MQRSCRHRSHNQAGLAVTVPGIFVSAIRASIKGTMNPCRFKYTHRVVIALMLGIVLPAKGMSYL